MNKIHFFYRVCIEMTLLFGFRICQLQLKYLILALKLLQLIYEHLVRTWTIQLGLVHSFLKFDQLLRLGGPLLLQEITLLFKLFDFVI